MKRPTRALAASIALTALACCETQEPALTRAQVQAMPDTDKLCQLYHTVQQSQTGRSNDVAPPNMAVIRGELMRRGATSQAEWNQTDAGKMTAGMHKCIIFALLGAPVSTKNSGFETSYQFAGGDIVFFQNGVVASFAHTPR